MKKKIETKIKLQVKACEANPSPPIGPALGSKGLNIMKFCNEFNMRTKEIKNLEKGTKVPVIINVYADKSFDFIIKSPPTSILIKNVLKLEKGSNYPNKNKVGTLTKSDLEKIIEQKKDDLIVNSYEAAINTLKGTAKTMGIDTNGI